jgi:hypothetical protein
MKVASQVADLRYLLAVAEARRQIGECKALAGGCGPLVTNRAATATPSVGMGLPAFKWCKLYLDEP